MRSLGSLIGMRILPQGLVSAFQEMAMIAMRHRIEFGTTDDQYADLVSRTQPAVQDLVRIPSYSTIDLSLAFSDKDDRYRLTLIGRNLTDEHYAALITRGGPANAPRLQIPREADRYFGAQFRVNFGGAR